MQRSNSRAPWPSPSTTVQFRMLESRRPLDETRVLKKSRLPGPLLLSRQRHLPLRLRRAFAEGARRSPWRLVHPGATTRNSTLLPPTDVDGRPASIDTESSIFERLSRVRTSKLERTPMETDTPVPATMSGRMTRGQLFPCPGPVGSSTGSTQATTLSMCQPLGRPPRSTKCGLFAAHILLPVHCLPQAGTSPIRELARSWQFWSPNTYGMLDGRNFRFVHSLKCLNVPWGCVPPQSGPGCEEIQLQQYSCGVPNANANEAFYFHYPNCKLDGDVAGTADQCCSYQRPDGVHCGTLPGAWILRANGQFCTTSLQCAQYNCNGGVCGGVPG